MAARILAISPLSVDNDIIFQKNIWKLSYSTYHVSLKKINYVHLAVCVPIQETQKVKANWEKINAILLISWMPLLLRFIIWGKLGKLDQD